MRIFDFVTDTLRAVCLGSLIEQVERAHVVCAAVDVEALPKARRGHRQLLERPVRGLDAIERSRRVLLRHVPPDWAADLGLALDDGS